MFKKLIIALVGLTVLLGGLYKINQLQRQAIASGGSYVPSPVSVTTAIVQEQLWHPTIEAIGSLTASLGVTLGSEVAGMVTAIHFESGQNAEKGDLLLELDASVEASQLKAATARLSLANINLERALELRDKKTISQSEVDTLQAQFAEAEAQVEILKTLIEKKSIRAPFSGQLGLREIDLGQYLTPGAAIVSLQSLHPIHLDFALPQQRISELRDGMPLSITLDAYPGETFSGRLTAIAPEVSVGTRSLSIQATFENPNGKLLPGMFARVIIPQEEETPSLVIPATAVLSAPYGDSVYIVEEKNGGKFATQKFVRVQKSRGDFVSIESGLSPGDSVVSTGAFKLRNGVPIQENNEFAPPAQMAPSPEDS